MEVNADQQLFSLSLSLKLFLFTSVNTCSFHSFYCMLQACEFRRKVKCIIDIFIDGVKHNFENISMFLLTKTMYRFPSKIPTKYLRDFPPFLATSKQLLFITAESLL